MTAAEVVSKKGAVLTIQRYEYHMAIVFIDLSNNTVKDKIFSVERINKDEEEELTAHQQINLLTRSYGNHPKHCNDLKFVTSDQLVEEVKKILSDYDYFFIWNRFTLKYLIEKLCVEKKNVFFVSEKIDPMTALFCGCCYRATTNIGCSATGVLAMIHYLRNNVKKDAFPSDMLLSNFDVVKIPVEELSGIEPCSDPFVSAEDNNLCIEGYTRLG